MREAQNCNPERHSSMVLFTGHFPTHECEIELNNFSCKDVGIWTCQMNGYKGKFYGLKKLNVTSINHCTYAYVKLGGGGVSGGCATPLRLKNPKKRPPLRPP